MHALPTDPLEHQVALRVVVGVFAVLPLLHQVERRLRDEDVPLFDQPFHEPVEEGQKQRTDVRAVHVGVGHDDDPVVPELGEVEVVVSEAGADRRDHRADLFVRQGAIQAGLLDVQDLSPQRQDRLERTVPRHLGAASGGVPLHQVELAAGGIGLAAVGELPGKAPAIQHPLAPGQLFRLAGRFPGARCRDALLDHPSGRRRVLFQVLREELPHDRLDDPRGLAVPQLRLRLPLELGVHELHAEDRRQPLPHVVSGKGLPLEDPALVAVRVEDAGHRLFEPDEVRASLGGRDIVDVR